MKDLEKIKSEDLGCQVQDANPGNFAIEQEVAQLVGATVPAPTEPSADDARELGAQLLVFLRRALLPIRSALRTALAAIYSHLDSRCTDYTPAAYAPYSAARRAYDPMGTLPARSVANLLTAITAFSARKISNGSAPSDGIPDGVSLAHILGASSVYSAIKVLLDDNERWVLTRAISLFPNIERMTLNFETTTLTADVVNGLSSLEYINFPFFYEFKVPSNGYHCIYDLQSLTEFHAANMDTIVLSGNGNMKSQFIGMCPALKKVELGRAAFNNPTGAGGTKFIIQDCGNIEELSVTSFQEINNMMPTAESTKLVTLQIRGIQANSCNLSWWNPTDKGTTFLQNFLEHIALRLTANGSGKTLTLSQAVFDSIWNADGTPKSTDHDSVIYQINKIIKTDKHWSVNRA